MGLPKASMLTRLNAQEADALDALFELGLPSVEVLGLAIALERKAGRHSMWHEYLESLAQDEPLPLLWTMQELKMLRGSGLDETSRRRKRRLVDNFRIAEAEWPSLSAATAFPSVQEYLAASTLSSSRAFRVDNQHGEGLLPLVDMLNHKASLCLAMERMDKVPAEIATKMMNKKRGRKHRRPSTLSRRDPSYPAWPWRRRQ